jgi:putative FmdB family regulatory protein
MPLYEYRCESCDHRFEVLQRMGEGNERLTCPRCGAGEPSKQFSTFASAASGGGTAASFGGGGCSAPAGSGFT